MRSLWFCAALLAAVIASTCAFAEVPECWPPSSYWGQMYNQALANAKIAGDTEAKTYFESLPRYSIYDYRDRSKPICSMTAAKSFLGPVGYLAIEESLVDYISEIRYGRVTLDGTEPNTYYVAIIRTADFNQVNLAKPKVSAIYDRLLPAYRVMRGQRNGTIPATSLDYWEIQKEMKNPEVRAVNDQQLLTDLTDRLAKEATEIKEKTRIAAAAERAAKLAYEAKLADTARREYQRTHTGVLGVVNAIREPFRLFGDWVSAYFASPLSGYINTAVLIVVLAAITSFKRPYYLDWRMFFSQVGAALAIFVIGLDLWAGQFGVEGWVDGAWRKDQEWSFLYVEIATVIATWLPGGLLWVWLEQGGASRYWVGGGVVIAASCIWVWPETVSGGIALLFIVPFLAFVITVALHSKVYGPASTIGAIFARPPLPEAPKPGAGPQAPTEHRSI